MSRGKEFTRQEDELHLGWVADRCAGHTAQQISDACSASRERVSSMTTMVLKADLQAIKSTKHPLNGAQLDAELRDHAAKYWRVRGGK